MGSRARYALMLLAPLFASRSSASELSDLIEKAPRLPVGLVRLPIEVELGFPSSVTVGRDGLVYILHRGEASDPVIVASRQGTVLRSWGKGMYKILTASGLAWMAMYGLWMQPAR